MPSGPSRRTMRPITETDMPSIHDQYAGDEPDAATLSSWLASHDSDFDEMGFSEDGESEGSYLDDPEDDDYPELDDC